MEGVINGSYYCQFERAAQINNGIYDRNVPSGPLNMSYNPRSVQTRYVMCLAKMRLSIIHTKLLIRDPRRLSPVLQATLTRNQDYRIDSSHCKKVHRPSSYQVLIAIYTK